MNLTVLGLTAAHWPTIRERERRGEKGGGREGKRGGGGGSNILATGGNKVIDLHVACKHFLFIIQKMKGSVIHYCTSCLSIV